MEKIQVHAGQHVTSNQARKELETIGDMEYPGELRDFWASASRRWPESFRTGIPDERLDDGIRHRQLPMSRIPLEPLLERGREQQADLITPVFGFPPALRLCRLSRHDLEPLRRWSVVISFATLLILHCNHVTIKVPVGDGSIGARNGAMDVRASTAPSGPPM
jgi:hypothetical protein